MTASLSMSKRMDGAAAHKLTRLQRILSDAESQRNFFSPRSMEQGRAYLFALKVVLPLALVGSAPPQLLTYSFKMHP